MNGVLNIEREIFIAASPETVFRYFVEPAFMARWFGEQHTLDPRPGSEIGHVCQTTDFG